MQTLQLLVSFTLFVFPDISFVRLLRFSVWDGAGRIEIQEFMNSERTEEQYSIAKAISIEKMAGG